MAQTIIIRGEGQRNLAKALIDRAPVDAVVCIKQGNRTLEQNAKLWAMLSDIARAKPEGRAMAPEMWKAAFMSALGHEIVWHPGIDNAPPFPAGFRTSRNIPFAGAYITQTWGRPAARSHAVQIEIDRSLYMVEKTLTPKPEFDQIRARLADALQILTRRLRQEGRAGPLAAE